MDLKELMDKNDYNKLKIIETHMNAKTSLSRKELAQQAHVSDFLAGNYLEAIAVLARDERFGFTLIKKTIKNIDFYSLKKSDNSNLKFIVFHFFEQSIDYQLLAMLQQKPGLSLPFLMDHFFLSESVLYAHIQHINQFLETYDIQIKKGKIVGSTLNIYYFFYYFYWFTLPLQEIYNRFYKPETELLLHFLEQKLAITFPENVRIQFYLWTTISFQQVKNEEKLSDYSMEFLSKIRKDELYQTLRQAYFMMNSATAFPGNEEFPIALYIFFTSIYILPSKMLSFSIDEAIESRNQSFDSVKQMQWIVQETLEELSIDLAALPVDVSDEICYLLTQAHQQLFYFKHYISSLNTNFFLSTYPFNQRVPKLMHLNACRLTKKIERFLGIHFDEQTYASVRYIYLTILKIVEPFSKERFTVGVFCYSSHLRMNLLVQQIQELFYQRYNAVCTIAEKTKHYDLLIADTSFFLENFSYDDYYILSGEPTELDLNKIAKKLDKIYKRKKQKK